MNLIAKTLLGLESVLAKEIEAIGGSNIEILKRAVSFEGDMEVLYKANLQLRTALSILKPIFSFHAKHENHFYKKIKAYDWEQILGLKDTFAIRSTVHSEYYNHSMYMALKMKDGIADFFNEKYGKRPNVSKANPTFPLQLHINGSLCTVLMDSTGEALYKRGYRVQSVEAPINEILAAGLVFLSAWDQVSPLVDPMCGGGTIPIEAAMMQKNIPPNLKREEWPFQKWKEYDVRVWEKVKQTAIDGIKKDTPSNIYAFDKEMGSIRKAELNSQEIPYLDGSIQFGRKSFFKLKKPAENGVLIFNPPYDERMAVNEVEAFYKAIGDQMKQEFTNYQAWIISSNKSALKRLGLRAGKKIPLQNGKLECRFINYDLYSGSKKAKHQHVEEI